MARKRIFVLGAGLAGLSAAWHLQRKGKHCLVFEKEPDVGGLCRSKAINGFVFDYSGHLLHFKHRYASSLIKDLLGNDLFQHKRSAWIYSHGNLSRYPFQANLYGLPAAIIKDCLLGFIQSIDNNPVKKQKGINFLLWINRTFGRGIARHFMVPYNTKFWTLSPRQMTCDWLDGFVPVPTLSQIIEGTVEESKRMIGYNARFFYPKRGGINQLPRAFVSGLKDIRTDCPATEIDLSKKEISFKSGEKERFDYLVSTIPLPELPHLIKGLPDRYAALFKKLRWNSIFNLNLGIGRRESSCRHWVYFPEKNISFFRVGYPHNFSSCAVPPGHSSLYVEAAYSKYKPINKDRIISGIKRDLKKAGFLREDERIRCEDTNDIEYGYPIYDHNYNSARSQIIEYLNQHNILACGRYGSWRYMSMEDVIMDGKNISDFILKDA